MIHLLSLLPDKIIILNDEDDEVIVDREHYEQVVDEWMYEDGYDARDLGGIGNFWNFTQQVNDSIFKEYTSRYLSTFRTLNTIEGLKIELT